MEEGKTGYVSPYAVAAACKSCVYARDRWRDSCYCTRYGVILYHGKRMCKGYEGMGVSEPGEIREPKNGG